MNVKKRGHNKRDIVNFSEEPTKNLYFEKVLLLNIWAFINIHFPLKYFIKKFLQIFKQVLKALISFYVAAYF